VLGEVALDCVDYAAVAWDVRLRVLLVLDHRVVGVASVRGVVVMTCTATAVF
jgi:hypothetical protein